MVGMAASTAEALAWQQKNVRHMSTFQQTDYSNAKDCNRQAATKATIDKYYSNWMARQWRPN
jgi:hypothetical protein